MEHLRAQLAAIVGDDHVLDDPETLDSFASDQSFAPAVRPVSVVRPGDERQVHALVVWANETRRPLVPVSSGPPHFHADTVPSVPGAVVVDLRRLDRVLRVDRRNRMAVIEPGVTYAALQPALAEHGMRVTPPLLPRANKSVVASLLERQPTVIPRYNFALPEPLRDCGVVWGSGDVLFTGEAGHGPRDLEDQWRAGIVQAEPKGPAQTDFYRLLTGAQGTMGIVTWASVKCELLAEARKLCFVAADRLEQLVPLVYRLCLLRLGDELMVLDRAYLSRILEASAAPAPDPAALPAWTLVLGLGGRRHYAAERLRVQEDDAARLAGEFGLRLSDELLGAAGDDVAAALGGLCPEPHWKLRGAGGSADVFFLSTLDRAGGHLALMQAAATSCGFSAADIGVYIQPQHQGVSHHVEFSLPYDPSDPVATRQARALHAAASAALIDAGAYFSRPYGAWAAPVYDRDAASREALRKVKAIFDPAGVLNPGKLCFGAPVAKEA
jgi:FAD/FMN-containing dehydrogenase